jgi:hypothetical protein
VALAVVLGLAALGQVRVWATGRAFWGDELAISINLREKAVTELADRLLYFQVAPVGWLATGKAMLVGFGEGERVLRLPSLVAGLVALGLVAVIADRAIGRWAAVAAVGLVGVTPAILYYAGELKQYSVETAVGLGLVAVGGALTRRQAGAARWWVIAAGAGFALVAVALSYSALVVLAGVAAGVVTHLALQRRWRNALMSVLVVAPAALLGAGLVLHRQSLPLHPTQDRFFPTGFPASDGGVGAVLEWLPDMWTELTVYPLGWRSPWWTLLLVAAGLVAFAARGRWQWVAIFGGVLAAAAGAAAAGGLPLAGRVSLYLVPVFVLLIVAGLAGVVQAIRRLAQRHRLPGWVWPAAATAVVVALAVAAGPPIRDGLAEVRDPAVRDTGRAALSTVAELRRPGDVVVVYHFSHKLIRWYGPGVGVGVAEVERFRLLPDGSPDCHPERLDEALAGARRVWYVYGTRLSSDPLDYQDRVARELARRGRIVETREYGDRSGGWVLVDLTAGADPNPPSVRPDPAYTCLSVD